MENHYDAIIIGGGAAGFFTAVNLAEKRPEWRIAILERGKEVLGKVRISGGGRCNLTHACFDPGELVSFYPRGRKALRGPFHTFAPGDTIAWFGERGVETKIEEDGRMFPVTDDSMTIVNCLMEAARNNGVAILLSHAVSAISPPDAPDKPFMLTISSGAELIADQVMVAPGSSQKVWSLLGTMGHTIVEPVPSLFTFNIRDPRIADLPGLSVPEATVKVQGTKLESSGPLLITHWGMSGPAILKMSAFGARDLHALAYDFTLVVSWTGLRPVDAEAQLFELRKAQPKKTVLKAGFPGIPNRLWAKLCESAEIPADRRLADLPNTLLRRLAQEIGAAEFPVKGKSTFKEEFVTAGGVDLKEVNFKRFESKIIPGMFFAGEILNIDGVTGGFNFQAAWTGSWIAANAMASRPYHR